MVQAVLMGDIPNLVRRHRFAAEVVAALVVFVVGLLVGGQRSGSTAEWAAAGGTLAAAGVALYLVGQVRPDSAERARAHVDQHLLRAVR
jgi:hypothetical protein